MSSALLVHRLVYNGNVAAGQMAVFQGASEVPISELISAERATRKTAIWTRPNGLRKKWASGCVARPLRIFRYAPSVRLGPLCRPPIFNATTSPLYSKRCTGAPNR